jgi:transcriptional regulator with XRE-family HTH domain
MPILGIMLLGDLLREKGVAGPSDFGRRLGISKQHAWLLWIGRTLPSLDMAQRIHQRLGISFEAMAALERVEPLKRRGPRPKSPGKPKNRRRPKQ